MDISKWNNGDCLIYCSKCNTDNIVRLVWILETAEPFVEKETGIIQCNDCNSKHHLKEKPSQSQYEYNILNS